MKLKIILYPPSISSLPTPYPLPSFHILSPYPLSSPISFNNVWVTNEERRPDNSHHILRNSSALTIPFTRLSTSSKHPLVNLPKTWIEFNNENIKILRNKLEFKFELKKHFLSELSAVVICDRLLCPSCHLNA